MFARVIPFKRIFEVKIIYKSSEDPGKGGNKRKFCPVSDCYTLAKIGEADSDTQ